VVDLVDGALGPGPWSLGSVRRRSAEGTKLIRPPRGNSAGRVVEQHVALVHVNSILGTVFWTTTVHSLVAFSRWL
jgi:hypothetical protein